MKKKEWLYRCKETSFISILRSKRTLGLLVIALGLGVFFITLHLTTKKPPDFFIAGLNSSQLQLLESWLQDEESGFGPEVLFNRDDDASVSRNTVLVIQPWSEQTITATAAWANIPAGLVAAMPRSVANTAMVSGELKAVPLALDHVELVFRRDLFAAQGLAVDERIPALAVLEQAMAAMAGPAFYPMVVAGGDDQTLMDLVSAMLLSISGPEVYGQFLSGLQSDQDSTLYSTEAIMAGPLAAVVTRLRDWRAAAYLHPEWLSFDRQTVRLFAERQITAMVLMRLSEHREWPFHILLRYQSSPFPFDQASWAGSALLAPVICAYIPANIKSRGKQKSLEVLAWLTSPEFQEKNVQSLKLGPVHHSVPSLDREADDLRYWAAASGKLMPSIADSLPPANASRLVEAIRNALAW